MKHKLLLITFLFFVFGVVAQTSYPENVKEMQHIKSDPNYYCGEGRGKNLKVANQEAMDAIIGQISTFVRSDFQRVVNQEDGDFNEKVEGLVQTYSQGQLNNVGQLLISESPDEVHIFRFVERSEVAKTFENRKQKIITYIAFGEKAEQKQQLSEALKNYYWSLMLTITHPENTLITFTDLRGEEHDAYVWLQSKIKDLLNAIHFEIGSVHDTKNMTSVNLTISCNNQPVTNLDYYYFNGQNWFGPVSAKDGRGTAEFLIMPDNNLRFRCEYKYENESNIDKELQYIMEHVDHPIFANNEKSIVLETKSKKKKTEKKTEPKNKPALETQVEQPKMESTLAVVNEAGYLSVMQRVEQAIRKKDWESVLDCFTREGYDMFCDLIRYGNATIIKNPEYKFLKSRDLIICRSIPMQFKFSHNKVFVEDVTFRFTQDAKIESLAFTLTQQAECDIMNKVQWNEQSRMTIVEFLEDYQTAYALKRLDYLQSIFSEDALIIVGRVLKQTPKTKDTPQLNSQELVEYVTYSKGEYMKKLEVSFASKEYINIRFADNEVYKAGDTIEVYGIQVRQNYYSNNYGDQGYLFLIVDLRNELPIIHVRSWQPEKDARFGLIDFNDFL